MIFYTALECAAKRFAKVNDAGAGSSTFANLLNQVTQIPRVERSHDSAWGGNAPYVRREHLSDFEDELAEERQDPEHTRCSRLGASNSCVGRVASSTLLIVSEGPYLVAIRHVSDGQYPPI